MQLEFLIAFLRKCFQHEMIAYFGLNHRPLLHPRLALMPQGYSAWK